MSAKEEVCDEEVCEMTGSDELHDLLVAETAFVDLQTALQQIGATTVHLQDAANAFNAATDRLRAYLVKQARR